jgi:hypothetical protein
VGWSLWKTRNDAVLNNKIIATILVVVIHKILMLLRTWRPVLKPKMHGGAGG